MGAAGRWYTREELETPGGRATEAIEDKQDILDWLDAYFSAAAHDGLLINALLDLQGRFGYLPRLGIRELAIRLGLSPAHAFGVATFYNHFRHTPPGDHPVQVCMGTACHIKQADKVLRHWERSLGISAGGVTEDRRYSLDRVACVGCCTLAPVAVVDGEVIGDVSPSKIDGILLRHSMARKKRSEGEP